MTPMPTGAVKNGYDNAFFAWIASGSFRSAKIVAPILMDLVAPISVVDVGCGVGSWLHAFAELGVEDCLGVDGDYVDRNSLMVPSDRFRAMDLLQPLAIDRVFDLAISMEVAEHLPASVAAKFVKFLTDLAPVVLFSAAIPGQGGTHHVNERWPWYWKDLFATRGYVRVDPIRPMIWNNPNVEFWYRQNTVVFVREASLPNYPKLHDLHRNAPEFALEAVAEGILRSAVDQPSVRTLLRMFPGSVQRAVRRRFFPTSKT